MNSEGVIQLHLQGRSLCVRLWFGVVASLAINLLLNKSLIRKYIPESFPAKRHLVTWLLQPVDIIVPMNKAKNVAHIACHIWKKVPGPEEVLLDSYTTKQIARHYVKQRVVSMIMKKPLYILLKNLSNKLVHLPKRTTLAHVAAGPAHIIAHEVALLKIDPETIGAEHYKPSVNKDTQMTGHDDVEARSEQKLNLDWKSEVQL